tara:strand:- start:1805 stop:2092 length:288 start_codon:yes stop_codon:yes gene_type:complete
MTRTKKRIYKRKPNNKKKIRRTKRIKRTKRTKRIKLKIKNLGKHRSYKRIQYGCNKSGMKGGGPIFQPWSDALRGSESNSNNVYNTFMGNDPNTN